MFTHSSTGVLADKVRRVGTRAVDRTNGIDWLS
jgi:hypothetical protein